VYMYTALAVGVSEAVEVARRATPNSAKRIVRSSKILSPA
jgi:hypothetical protein